MQRIEPKLDIRDLQVVLALAAARTTKRAAETLHLTQSAVSRALLVVESKLGVPVFERTPHGLVPTTAGERLIGGAGAVLAQLAQLEAHASEPTTQPERVRVVCECYTAYRWLPSAVAQLHARLPRLEVELALEHREDPVAALEAGDVDVALLTTSPIHRPLLEEPLFADEIVFVVAASHPLATRPALTRADLKAHPLIASSGSSSAETRWFLSEVFGRSVPKLTFLRLPLTEAILDVARAGMGIAVMSEWVASAHLGEDLVARRLSSGPIERPWRIAYRRDHADAAHILGRALEGSAPRIYPAARARR